MNKFSKMMGVTALSMSLTVPALAEVSAPVNNNEQVQNELAYAFGENTDLQAKAMTGQDMQDTQGAVAPWVAGAGLGAAVGAAGYTYGWARGNYNWSNAKFAGNVGTGAVIGGTFGAAGAAAGGGMSVGANAWRLNSFSLNYGLNKAWSR